MLIVKLNLLSAEHSFLSLLWGCDAPHKIIDNLIALVCEQWIILQILLFQNTFIFELFILSFTAVVFDVLLFLGTWC